MILSKRLMAIIDFLKYKSSVIDVGCHHGLVDIYLKINYPKIKLLATDNKKGSLDCAIKNFKQYDVNIKTKLTNGLDDISINKEDTILISGMGTYTILKILNNKYDNINDIVIQSNNEIYLLRKEIINHNFYIDDEKVVYDKGKYYVIINFKKGTKEYTYEDLVLGPLIRYYNDNITSDYFNSILENYKLRLEKIPLTEEDRRNKLIKIIDIIKNRTSN